MLFKKSIDSLLEQHATTVVVTDRKTLNTDTIVFDFEGFSNGEKLNMAMQKIIHWI